MSFDDLHSSLLVSNGRPATEGVDTELDIRLLASLVAGDEAITADDSELLARLDSADTMASGVEARLDEILGTLDDLLTSLEPKGTGKSHEGSMIPPAEAQSERPPSEQS